MKIIFLDIDGVLNSESWASVFGWGETVKQKHIRNKPNPSKEMVHRAKLNPSSVLLLNRLCKSYKSKVIISSTWRLSDGGYLGNDLNYWNSLFKEICNSYSTKCYIDVIDITPYLDNRGEEIQESLNKHKPSGYCVIDDIDDNLTDLHDEHVCLINGQYGFGMPDLLECEHILSEVNQKSFLATTLERIENMSTEDFEKICNVHGYKPKRK